MSMQQQILLPEAKNLLPKLTNLPELADFYLAGGTALALQLGHRESVDFDFFTGKDFYLDIESCFADLGEISVTANAKNYSEFILNGVKIMLMSYFYPLTKSPLVFEKLSIATITDIGLMKINALEGRMNWKDIVDLYFIDKEITLESLTSIYLEQYPQDKLNQYSKLRILLNSDEINKSPKPKMLVDIDFEMARELVFEKLAHGFGNLVKLQ